MKSQQVVERLSKEIYFRSFHQ